MSQKPRLLINASTCIVGGGVQVSVGFLHYVHSHLEEIGWEVLAVASPKVFEQCRELPARTGWRLELIQPTPASVLWGRSSRSFIHRLIQEIKPEMCFTVFGPSYLWLSIPEFCGFADPSVTNPNQYFLKNHPLRERLATRFRSWVKTRMVRRVQEFWVETETARMGLSKKLGISAERISVVANAVNPLFQPVLSEPPTGKFVFLFLSAFYYHKNHAILIPVAQALRQNHSDFDFEFVVTLPADHPQWLKILVHATRLGLGKHFRTLGYLSVKECAQAYATSHVVFHPSLLEVFSATYLEAFASRRPVVATDLDFSREVCGDAALYFHPTKPDVAAEALYLAATHLPTTQKLIQKGRDRLLCFPPSGDKNDRLISLINNFRNRHGLG